MRLSELARLIEVEIPTEGDKIIDGVASLDQATPGTLSAYLSPQWRTAAATTKASAVIISPANAHELCATATPLFSDDPRAAWGRALRALFPRSTPQSLPPGVHPSAVIEPSATVSDSACVGPLAYIGRKCRIAAGAQIGAGARVDDESVVGTGTLVMMNAVVTGGSQIGTDVWIGAGSVIGGFGFGLDATGRLPHVGRVVVGDRTTIGANCCIDRSTVAETSIGHDCHIDNLVQIGHNVRIGHGVVICGQVGIAGGTTLGDAIVVGGQAGIAGHLTIASGVQIAAQSGVTRRLDQPGAYSGHPAEPNRQRLRRLAQLKKMAQDDE